MMNKEHKMDAKTIKATLTKWAKKNFQGAESIKVVRDKFGDWNVEVDWDGGCFEEIYSFAYQNGKFRSLGVTEINY